MKKTTILILIFLGLVLPLLVSAIEIENPLGAKTFEEFIDRVLTFIFLISLGLVPLMIVIAGIFFVTAAGDPVKIEKAKAIILYTLIGFIIIILAKGFVEFLRQIF